MHPPACRCLAGSTDWNLGRPHFKTHCSHCPGALVHLVPPLRHLPLSTEVVCIHQVTTDWIICFYFPSFGTSENTETVFLPTLCPIFPQINLARSSSL